MASLLNGESTVNKATTDDYSMHDARDMEAFDLNNPKSYDSKSQLDLRQNYIEAQNRNTILDAYNNTESQSSISITTPQSIDPPIHTNNNNNSKNSNNVHFGPFLTEPHPSPLKNRSNKNLNHHAMDSKEDSNNSKHRFADQPIDFLRIWIQRENQERDTNEVRTICRQIQKANLLRDRWVYRDKNGNFPHALIEDKDC
eukprot:UN07842